VDIMDKILKESFVKIHTDNPLKQFKSYVEKKYEIRLPDIPEREDDFDINEVLESQYFFS